MLPQPVQLRGPHFGFRGQRELALGEARAFELRPQEIRLRYLPGLVTGARGLLRFRPEPLLLFEEIDLPAHEEEREPRTADPPFEIEPGPSEPRLGSPRLESRDLLAEPALARPVERLRHPDGEVARLHRPDLDAPEAVVLDPERQGGIGHGARLRNPGALRGDLGARLRDLGARGFRFLDQPRERRVLRVRAPGERRGDRRDEYESSNHEVRAPDSIARTTRRDERAPQTISSAATSRGRTGLRSGVRGLPAPGRMPAADRDAQTEVLARAVVVSSPAVRRPAPGSAPAGSARIAPVPPGAARPAGRRRRSTVAPSASSWRRAASLSPTGTHTRLAPPSRRSRA